MDIQYDAKTTSHPKRSPCSENNQHFQEHPAQTSTTIAYYRSAHGMKSVYVFIGKGLGVPMQWADVV
jgi:hypothetical protein